MTPFLQGRPPSPNPSLRCTITARPTGRDGSADPPAEGAPSGPTVECVKQGDKIVRLIVTCSCGEHLEIECLYGEGG